MPIAHCRLRSSLRYSPENLSALIELWSDYAGIASEEMTVTLVSVDQIAGRHYSAMAELQLPTLWSKAQVADLQLGLARALSHFFALPAAEVIVLTNLVAAGHVVDSGEVQEW